MYYSLKIIIFALCVRENGMYESIFKKVSKKMLNKLKERFPQTAYVLVDIIEIKSSLAWMLE